MQIVNAEVVTTGFGFLLSTAFTIGVLKQGQSESRKRLDDHATAQQKELAGVRETLEHMAAEIHGAITAAARHDERLSALERSTEERLGGVRASLDRSVREATLAREELKGDVKRHGRDLEGLKVWRAGVNQHLAKDPLWRSE